MPRDHRIDEDKSISEKRERYIFLMPRPVQLALVNFDGGKPPKPFKFKLRTKQTVLMKDPLDGGKES
jgi:hypothetical protein